MNIFSTYQYKMKARSERVPHLKICEIIVPDMDQYDFPDSFDALNRWDVYQRRRCDIWNRRFADRQSYESGEAIKQQLQLRMAYDPQPPFLGHQLPPARDASNVTGGLD